MMQIHEKIKQARLLAKLTEDELAKKIGVKRSTYQYWEQVTPSIDRIKKVAKALGKSEDYFFGTADENDEKPESLSMKAIADIAAANKELAESNRKLTDELISYRSLSKNPIADAARWSDFLELLAGIASGDTKYRSKKEALAALHKFSHVAAE